MSRKLLFLTSFVLVLSVFGTRVAFGQVWEGRIADGQDDWEQLDGGTMRSATSSDIEMPYEDTGQGDKQVSGLRFVDVRIPAGSVITNAYLEFVVDETKGGNEHVSLLIEAEKTANAEPMTSSNDVASRPRTNAKVIWVPEDWTAADQVSQSSDISAIIQELMERRNGQPEPADGALHRETWVSLSWKQGWESGNSILMIVSDDPDNPSVGIRCAESFNGDQGDAALLHIEYTAGQAAAVMHDVYLSDNFDDVNDGTGDAFRGNQVNTDFVAGFPGFPFPDGLVPGTTYYWRVDLVEADGTTQRGPVWSFSVPTFEAFSPLPADGAKFVAPDATLEWMPGFGAKLHTVHFGDNFDDVSNAVAGLPIANTTFTPPGPLEADKIYYWRVDELNPPVTTKGAVWSFTVAGAGGGVKGQYFNGMNFNNLVLTRTDPQIDFNWGDPGGPDQAAGDDQFSARWTGQVEAVFTETYTFYTNSDDGVRLWIDGKRIINNWTNHANTEDRGEIDLIGGQKYSLVMEYYEDGGGAVAQLRWESPSTRKELIPSAALSFLTSAHSPAPANGIVGVKLEGPLTWSPGESAASHEVYFGTDPDAVASATKASPEFKGTKQLGDESLDPGVLAFNTDYFWRVDEVNNTNPDSPWEGSVWSFSTGPFLLVDDFEPYNNIDPPDEASNRIFDKWIDGFGTTTNGALVGNDLPPYAEQNIVHGGAQSMILRYDNANKFSEATLTLVWPRDWTAEGVTKLSVWFRGSGSNAADSIFVALNGTAVASHPDPAATQLGGWNEWVVDLAAFGVDLANVNSITIGVGTKGVANPAGGAGTLHFDDIRLVP